ncbi:hypothetical protein CRV24_004179 [Beauveria bassiana]|uniref:Uncharacterized protein n=1 Tax=Beauveria bassiana (strain ARSEF 2860) TaxID=655819 RepID=J4KQ47_BEAB2|nr:uncharacterized protein BBA_02576 [Beauveria bassiana ARSEF 2860]EJP68574.1 hypothetical protein BBA_02576 [Beauveria bassiana ARSEF 2860]KAF1735257.1 hypothetical protein CRV24_004179 [Beauveria bassiana]KAH8710795.1 hypothetical protein HC256_007625 [Beauveria bassiana]
MALNATRRFFTGFTAALAASDRTNKRATAVPTREQLCVGFNDIEACQRKTKACSKELRAKGVFSCADVSKCVAKKRFGGCTAKKYDFEGRYSRRHDPLGVVDVEGSSD